MERRSSSVRLGMGAHRAEMLSHAPNVTHRASVTADSHGIIISTNEAVQRLFGYDPADLVGKSCRELMQLLARKRPPKSVSSLTLQRRDSLGSTRFSRTDLWQDLMADVLSQRIVNGRHQDGSLIPLKMSTSALKVGDHRIFALLFEALPAGAAVVTMECHGEGEVLSATSNVSDVLGCSARDMPGHPLSQFVQSASLDFLLDSVAAVRSKVGKDAKHISGVPLQLPVSATKAPVSLQVIDDRHNMLVCTIKRASAPADAAAKKATEIGFYTFATEGDLGTGQCGMVRRAVHRTTGTEVAVKTLSKEQFQSIGLPWPGREPEILKHLNHPNIVQLFDIVPVQDCSYLILELVKGGELLAYCFANGPLPEVRARTFFRDLLGAVDYLHRKGIVHRDLKLENCLLDEAQNSLKIIDFGLGNFFLDGPLKTSCGSADYAAPELFTSAKYYGPPVDVWAMGVVLFAMLSGEFPFADVQATMNGEYAWPTSKTWGTSVSSLVADIFELNPDLRLTVDQIRRHDWVNQGFTAPTARPPVQSAPSLTPNKALTKKPSGGSPQVNRDQMSFRVDLLLLMERAYGYAAEAVAESLCAGDINQMTATYKMLLLANTKEIALQRQSLARADEIRRAVADMERRRKLGLSFDLAQMRDSIRVRSASSSEARPSVLDAIMAKHGEGPLSRRGSMRAGQLPMVGVHNVRMAVSAHNTPREDTTDDTDTRATSRDDTDTRGRASIMGGVVQTTWRRPARKNSAGDAPLDSSEAPARNTNSGPELPPRPRTGSGSGAKK